jgi:ubiquinone/menaquinone biosynthesis C-methylase UbiE
LTRREDYKDRDFQPVGNYYDKYGTRNPIEKYLVGNFFKSVFDAIEPLRPDHVLDIGCGEGIVTAMLQEKYPGTTVVGVDIDYDFVSRMASKRVKMPVINALPHLCFPGETFDLVVMLEVLEHLPDPEKSVQEIRRVASRNLIITVPHEPWWRMCNVLRLKYVGQLGNTPGHINHFSRNSLKRLLSEFFTRVEVRSVFPWLMAVCEK